MTDPQRIVTTIVNTFAMGGGVARAHPELVSFEGRRTIYEAWTKQVRGAAGTQRHKSLEWFSKTYPRYPLQDLASTRSRILLLCQLDSLHEQLTKDDSSLPLVLKCMETQVPLDYMRICAVDLLYLNLGSSKVADSEQGIQLAARQLINNLHSLPWKAPTARSLGYLEGMFMQRVTRTAAYADITKFLGSFQTKSSHGEHAPKKLEFWLEFLDRMVSLHSPTPLVVPSMVSRMQTLHVRLFKPTLLGREDEEADDEYAKLEPMLVALIQKLQDNATQANQTARPPYQLDFATSIPAEAALVRFAGPALHSPTKTPAKSQASQSRPFAPEVHDRDFNEAAPAPLIKVDSAHVQHTVDRPSSAHYHRESIRQLGANDVFAEVPDIWMQMDPIVDRIVTQTSVENEGPPAEVLVSTRPGTLSIARNNIIWKAVDKEDGKNGTESPENSDKTDKDVNSEIVIMWKEVARWNFTKIGTSDASFLAIHTSQAYKFFPFYDTETFELTSALVDLTGRDPFDEKVYVSKVIQDRLAAKRQEALRKLVEVYGDESWIIDNTRELLQLLAALTKPEKKQNLYDIERLFHSCRLNEEVTKESLQELRRIFNETLDRKVKAKVLAVCDRLVDRAVVHVGDYNFNYVSAWLKKVEAHLDPYRSAESLTQVRELRARLDEFKRQAIRGIPASQMTEMFDYLSEMKQYKKQRS